MILSWTPFVPAESFDVYFGASLDDVSAAERANPLAVLVSEGQAGRTYVPEGLLEFSQTYYWGVDEIGPPPESTIYRGFVWEFTTELYAYPIQDVIATASRADAGSQPERTIDGSGLDEDDQHSTLATDMWLGEVGAESVWIQYEFDRVYKLHQMQVCNCNVRFELVLGMGLKDVAVEYSDDGVDWTRLGDFEFA